MEFAENSSKALQALEKQEHEKQQNKVGDQFKENLKRKKGDLKRLYISIIMSV